MHQSTYAHVHASKMAFYISWQTKTSKWQWKFVYVLKLHDSVSLKCPSLQAHKEKTMFYSVSNSIYSLYFPNRLFYVGSHGWWRIQCIIASISHYPGDTSRVFNFTSERENQYNTYIKMYISQALFIHKNTLRMSKVNFHVVMLSPRDNILRLAIIQTDRTLYLSNHGCWNCKYANKNFNSGLRNIQCERSDYEYPWISC